ncbi:MAG: HAD family hydrolase [Pseudomonadota bacterium]
MIDGIYGYIEGRVLAWEAARRGQRHAGRMVRDEAAIGALGDVPALVGDAALVSFDLFDTLLHRTRLAPEAITRKTAGFARLIAGARAGEAVFTARHRFAVRAKAAMIAAGTGDEPPLVDLFADALRAAGIADADTLAARLVAFETEVERAGIRAADGAIDVLDRVTADGRKTVAISDMYLPAEAITAMLARAGLGDRFDNVFVSAEEGWTKKSSRLYQIVAERLEVDPAHCLHIGDRIDSDVRPARAAGWRALHFVEEHQVAKAEARRIIDSHVPTPALRAADIGRALSIADPAPLASLDRIIDQLIGPAAGLLALRGLGQMSKCAAPRLYHLSRDATVIGEIADLARITHPHLAPPDAEVRPLSVNRVQGALLTLRTDDDIAALDHLVPYLTGRPASAEALIAAFGLLQDDFTDQMMAVEGPEFLALARDDRRFRVALATKRVAVETYLDAIGLTGPGGAVLMDIGYSGTFGVQLSALLHDRPPVPRQIECLFLMTSRYLNGNLRLLHPQIRLHPGIALDHRRRSARWASWNFAWAEPFFVDPDRGKLRGYEGGEPVFDPSPLDEATRAHRRVILGAIRTRALRFIDEFHRAPGDAEEVAALLQTRMERFVGRPSRSEELAMRDLSHQSGQSKIAVRDMTRTVNPIRLRSELRDMRFDDYWVQGSLARSGLGLVNRAMADAPTADQRADPRAMWD